VPNGLKLRDPDRVTRGTPTRWREIVETLTEDDARQEGFEYARTGQVASLEIGAGEVRATVQGRSARPYQTAIAWRPFDEEQWNRLIVMLASEAGFSARLLAGEVPPGLDTRLAADGLDLLPARVDGVSVRCTCGTDSACKHAVALGYVVGERFDDDPMLLFTLRGLPVVKMLERLRQTRSVQTAGYAAAHADPAIPETQVPPPPLEECVEGFWEAGPQADSEVAPSSYAPHALLRRLGPSPLVGRFPMVGLLASIYDTVAETAGRVIDDENGADDNR
jgi:uncharacterized Zn finger protein